MSHEVLAIPTMSRRQQVVMLATLPRLCLACGGEERVPCDTCHGARVVGGRRPLDFLAPVEFGRRYKAIRNVDGQRWYCYHMHRTASAARRCRQKP